MSERVVMLVWVIAVVVMMACTGCTDQCNEGDHQCFEGSIEKCVDGNWVEYQDCGDLQCCTVEGCGCIACRRSCEL